MIIALAICEGPNCARNNRVSDGAMTLSAADEKALRVRLEFEEWEGDKLCPRCKRESRRERG